MAWDDGLGRVNIGGRAVIAASFRGVAFFVESSTLAGGRRVAEHEFPLRDEPFGEDLGRKARTFSVSGYVVGEDVAEQTQALIDALESPGPATLLHPTRGEKVCACTSYSCTEATAEGRVSSFAITFFETPAQAPQPSAIVNTVASARADVTAVRAAAQLEFVATYDPDVPAFSLATVESAIRKANAAAQKALAPALAKADDAAALRRQVARIDSELTTLLLLPADLFTDMQALYRFVISPPSIVSALAGAYGAIVDELFPDYPEDTQTRSKEQINWHATQAMNRRLALCGAADSAVLGSYETEQEAQTVRADLAEKLDTELELATDDATYSAIATMRASIISTIPQRARARRRLVVVASAVPSLVVAHEVYGSTDRELELCSRNRFAHPGFVHGGVEVLDRV